MIKLKIKKGATVEVIAGADKGKRGTVLEIAKDKMMVRVQGVRMQTHYSTEGMSKREGLLHYSNVKMIEAAAGAAPKKKAAKKAAKSKTA